jgi:hypothetical protein
MPAIGKTTGTLLRTVPKAVCIPTLAAGTVLAGTPQAEGPGDPLNLLRERQGTIQTQMDEAAAKMQQTAPKPRKPNQPPADQNSDLNISTPNLATTV